MKIYSLGLIGTDTFTIEIEARFSRGLPLTNIIGIGTDPARGLRERVAAALEASCIKLPQRRSIINIHSSIPLKLSHLPTELLDLPVALLLLAAGVPELNCLLVSSKRPCFAAGELTLSGEVRPLTEWACVARHQQKLSPLPRPHEEHPHEPPQAPARPYWITGGICAEAPGWSALPTPYKDAHFAQIHIVPSLASLRHGLPKPRAGHAPSARKDAARLTSIDSVVRTTPAQKTQQDKRQRQHHPSAAETAPPALEPFQQVCLMLGSIARLHMLFAGPPGTGKTFLCEAIGRIQPLLDPAEVVELALINQAGRDGTRPFRKPHSSATVQSFTGGARLQAGEFAKAHAGILFLDEIAEFSPQALEALRQPLDEGSVLLTRAGGSAQFPTRFQLLATMNPCPCGNHFAPAAPCRCTPSIVRRYLARLSGPLLDRLHVCVWLNPSELEATGAQRWAGSLLRFTQKPNLPPPKVRAQETPQISTCAPARRQTRNGELTDALRQLFPDAPHDLIAQSETYLQSFRTLLKEGSAYI